VADRIHNDPAEPLEMELDFRSVHVVGYRLRYRPPEGPWVDIDSGSSADDEPTYDLPPLPWGSEIQYRFLYSDEDGDDFEAALIFRQGGGAIGGSPVMVTEDGDVGGVEGLVECSERDEEDEE